MEIIIKGVKILLRYGAYSSGMIVTILLVILLFGGDEIMQINNPPDRVDYIKTIGGGIIRPHLVDIGTWNMDLATSKLVAHGLGDDWSKIVSITFIIFDDAGLQYRPAPGYQNGADPNLVSVGVNYIDSTNLALSRRAGGLFDSTNFDDAVMNRGKILFWLEE